MSYVSSPYDRDTFPGRFRPAVFSRSAIFRCRRSLHTLSTVLVTGTIDISVSKRCVDYCALHIVSAPSRGGGGGEGERRRRKGERPFPPKNPLFLADRFGPAQVRCPIGILETTVASALRWPSQTSVRDSMVFGFIIAYLGRPRRIIAHEDPTRREIYGRTRCNSPTETGRHSQINSGKRRHESGLSSFEQRTRAHTRIPRTYRAGAYADTRRLREK